MWSFSARSLKIYKVLKSSYINRWSEFTNHNLNFTMDVIKPDLMWLEGCCFRITSSDEPYMRKQENLEELYAEDDEFDNTTCNSEELFDDFEVETTEAGRFRTSFHVPRVYFPYVIGQKGNTRRRLENETKTQIRVPKMGQDGDIIITGTAKKGVCAARRRIDLIVMSARQKQQFTHFISIPMTSDNIKTRFIDLKNNILETCSDRNVEESIFQNPDKLHLTIGTLTLSSTVERNRAAEILQESKELIIDPLLQGTALEVQMVGLEYMNDDPAEVDILYGKVNVQDHSSLLQQLADNLVDFFTSKGLMQKQYTQVKLHVTLMNTLFRTDRGIESDMYNSKDRQKARESFDATNILKMFENYDFGTHIVNEIDLSQRYSSDSNGYYKSSSVLKL